MISILLLFFIIGCAVGSFLNVVIDRSVRRESLLGRSYCDHCKASLGTIDLMPILSFAVLGARCRYCHKPISWQYPIVEFTSGFLFALAFLVLSIRGEQGVIGLLYYFLLISTIIIVSTIDLKFSLIPTSLFFFASLVSLFYNYFFLSSALFVDHVLMAFILALMFLIIVLVTRGRGMGEGDIVMAFFVGMVLGIGAGIVAIFLSFLLGALASIFLIVAGKKKFGQTVPFGPFLASGFLISFFWAREIINWYLMVY